MDNKGEVKKKVFCIDCKSVSIDSAYYKNVECNNPACFQVEYHIVTGEYKARKNGYNCYALNKNYDCQYHEEDEEQSGIKRRKLYKLFGR